MDKSAELYKSIIKPISSYSLEFEDYFKQYFLQKSASPDKNPIIPIINEFFEKKGKRIRSNLLFLLTKALKKEIENNHFKIALALELIHNATLIHDDIIDCSMLRRGEKTLNFEYNSKLAVLAGDFLLSEAIVLIDSLENEKIKNVFSNTLSKLVQGELFQYFNRFKILDINDYVEKSKNKTARLFEAGIVSAYIYSGKNYENLESVKDFALNFGTGFQIVNDLKNIKNEEEISEDLQNGDYNAPIIFYAQGKTENAKDLLSNNPKDILKKLNNSDAIIKTEQLANSYFSKAIENISFIEDNLYKKSLIDLCQMYKNEK